MNPTHPTAARVLVVEDEGDLRDGIVEYLELEGFQVDGAGTLAAASARMQAQRYDIVILDLGLPDGDGLQWLGDSGSLQGAAVIITTARGALEERVRGVETGADVYLVKPVPLAELAALTRRMATRLVQPTAPEAPRPWQLHAVNWTLVAPSGAAVRLTHSERIVLSQLAAVPGKAVSRVSLSVALGHDASSAPDLRRLEILVHRLRAKVKTQTGESLPLETAHGHGYAFIDEIVVVSRAATAAP